MNNTVEADPGYFAITLNTSVKVEMTVKEHAALYRITFPRNLTTPTSKNSSALPYTPVILFDLTDLPETRINGTIGVSWKPSKGRFYGSGTFVPSFGLGTYDAHFCADAYAASENFIVDGGVFMNNRAGSRPNQEPVTIVPNGNTPLVPAGAWLKFAAPPDDEIYLRVAVSLYSAERACELIEFEFRDLEKGNYGNTFELTRRAAQDLWREKLSVIEISSTGVSTELSTVFWSGAYRAMISPQDYTGQNPLWESDEPYYDSYYCIWDSFRSIHPLLTLVDPQSQTRMVRSLIDIYRHEGKRPRRYDK